MGSTFSFEGTVTSPRPASPPTPKRSKPGADSSIVTTPAANWITRLSKIYTLEKNRIRIKPYPCGGLTHSAIYATIRLRDEQHSTASQIEHIDVFVPADIAAPWQAPGENGV